MVSVFNCSKVQFCNISVANLTAICQKNMTCYQQDRAFKNFRKINNDKKGKTNTRDRNNDLIR